MGDPLSLVSPTGAMVVLLSDANLASIDRSVRTLSVRLDKGSPNEFIGLKKPRQSLDILKVKVFRVLRSYTPKHSRNGLLSFTTKCPWLTIQGSFKFMYRNCIL